MEILLGIVLVVLFISILGAVDKSGKPTDSREPYARDARGRVWALKVGEGVSHEEYIHDGTPHQNPAVRTETRWWFIFSYSVDVSYYPITINGRLLPDLEGIQERVDEGRRRG